MVTVSSQHRLQGAGTGITRALRSHTGIRVHVEEVLQLLSRLTISTRVNLAQEEQCGNVSLLPFQK